MSGRLTMLTTELAAQAARLAPRLVYQCLVADALGVHRRTFDRWMARGRKEEARLHKGGEEPIEAEAPYLTLVTSFKKGVAKLLRNALASVVKASRNGTWQAGAWILERCGDGAFAKPEERVANLERQLAEMERRYRELAGGR